jgi:hypothetical protein
MTDPSLRDNRTRQDVEHLERAARVLTSLIENHFPDPDDVAELRRFAPEAADKTIDELVCNVIQKVLKHSAAGNDTRSAEDVR